MAILLWLLTTALAPADWPTYRADTARSGYTTESLPIELHLKWKHQSGHAPRPAWPGQKRLPFDRVFHPIVAGGMLYFGSSVDGRIHALDADNGKEKWTFFTEGPVRFAPVFHQGRILVTSDDGHLYCLDAAQGKLIWKIRGGPTDDRVLGNDRVISRWPARGGPLVKENIVYFAAGIWPSEGVYLHAIDFESGKRLWLNDSSGSIYMGQPHGGAYARSGVAAQGYLAASEGQLFVPTGRSVPAVFNRSNGEFQYFHLQKNGHRGGSEVLVSDRFFLNNGIAFMTDSGDAGAKAPSEVLAAPPGQLLAVTGKTLKGYHWADLESIDRKGEKEIRRGVVEDFSMDLQHTAVSLVAANNKAIIGGAGRVSVADFAAGDSPWSVEVDGTAYGLAVAGGALFVSTDQGTIYAFAQATGDDHTDRSSVTRQDPQTGSENHANAAEEIIRLSGVREGYCVDLGCGDGQLALEMVKRTHLIIYGIENDPEKVILAREKAISAGLSDRITILHADPNQVQLPAYFANLIISGRSVSDGLGTVARSVQERIQRPYGGISCLGKPGEMQLEKREDLPGAGNWTHQYADPGNTVSSADERVRGSLRMLWFTKIDHPIPQRHGRGPAPLVLDGILYAEGLDGIMAVDAYNGRKLWAYPLPGILKGYDGDHLMGTSGSQSNFCVSENGLFVRRDDYCLRIDPVSGKLLDRFDAPRSDDNSLPIWGFIAHDHGVLLGSQADPEHVVTYRYVKGGDLGAQLTESTALFGLDARTGEPLWRYQAEHSIRHNAIASGNGQVVFLDRPLNAYDRTREGKPDPEKGETPATLVCLNTRTGDVLWKNTEEIYGTVVALSAEHQAITVAYQPTAFRLASEIGGRIAAFRLSDGSRLWEKKEAYASRPLIIDRTIYAQGAAWDLMSGEERPFHFKRSYGCGQLAASRYLLTFRSATLGTFDLEENDKIKDFGGFRPGCWINAIPAGGLVFAPDASAGCRCSYQNQAWIALEPYRDESPSPEETGDPKREGPQ